MDVTAYPVASQRAVQNGVENQNPIFHVSDDKHPSESATEAEVKRERAYTGKFALSVLGVCVDYSDRCESVGTTSRAIMPQKQAIRIQAETEGCFSEKGMGLLLITSHTSYVHSKHHW